MLSENNPYSLAQDQRLPGRQYDEETGLYFNRRRYYNPRQGRYITQDPIGLMREWNLYQYPLNPITNIDPLGLSVQSALGPFINSPGIQFSASNVMSGDRLNINPGTYEILNSTYNDMKRLNLRESDQFFHCSAFCRVSKSNNSNKTWASTLGGIKEIRDYMFNTFGLYGSGKLSDSEMIQDNIEDLKVNQHGLSCPSQQNCSDRCSKYLNQDHKDTMSVLKNEGYLE